MVLQEKVGISNLKLLPQSIQCSVRLSLEAVVNSS